MHCRLYFGQWVPNLYDSHFSIRTLQWHHLPHPKGPHSNRHWHQNEMQRSKVIWVVHIARETLIGLSLFYNSIKMFKCLESFKSLVIQEYPILIKTCPVMANKLPGTQAGDHMWTKIMIMNRKLDGCAQWVSMAQPSFSLKDLTYHLEQWHPPQDILVRLLSETYIHTTWLKIPFSQMKNGGLQKQAHPNIRKQARKYDWLMSLPSSSP